MTGNDEFMTRYMEQERLRALLGPEVNEHNKTVLFGALLEAGIACVAVEFDGYGDSGQIERVVFLRPDNSECEGPSTQVDLRSTRYDGSGIESETVPLGDAIERMAYRFLEDSYGGWENNDGAYGTFNFLVEPRTISLVYNERYEATQTFEHQF